MRGIQCTLCQGVTMRCCLSLLTNSALVYRGQMRGGGIAGPQPVSAAVHITWHGAHINFGDLPPYLTYALCIIQSNCGFTWTEPTLKKGGTNSFIHCDLYTSSFTWRKFFFTCTVTWYSFCFMLNKDDIRSNTHLGFLQSYCSSFIEISLKVKWG